MKQSFFHLFFKLFSEFENHWRNSVDTVYVSNCASLGEWMIDMKRTALLWREVELSNN